MEFFDTVLTRRSVREFSRQPVAQEDIIKILEAGIHAPSSKNSQPWFFVVDTTNKKNRVAEIVEQQADSTFTVMDQRTDKPARVTTALESARALREAPAVIFVFCTSPFTGGRQEVLKKPTISSLLSFSSEIESVAAATQNMLLAANALGLGALWNCDMYYVADQIEELYGVKHDFMLCLCIGYTREDTKKNFRVRHPKYTFVESENHTNISTIPTNNPT